MEAKIKMQKLFPLKMYPFNLINYMYDIALTMFSTIILP